MTRRLSVDGSHNKAQTRGVSTIAINVSKPIEEFIQRKVAAGYPNVDEVARQAFLRWMENDDESAHIDARPPGIDEKMREAARSPLRKVDEGRIERIMAGVA